ncbi:unnamed protein product [Arctia plantaginis]|uniref:Uncharacterized protein n=1 Tax=Arctia plantaginis TaxID=874455 RepID=A0A8S0YSB4_ARCPL|nr:unnamed protein product [Arctia plantaginis]
MENWFKLIAKTTSPPPFDCEQSDEKTEDVRINDKSGTEADSQVPSTNKYGKLKLLDMKSSKNIRAHFININENDSYASYLISLMIAWPGNPHSIGEGLMLPSLKDAVEAMFGEKKVQEIKRIPLSNITVA